MGYTTSYCLATTQEMLMRKSPSSALGVGDAKAMNIVASYLIATMNIVAEIVVGGSRN
jgi:hypothetical protein